MNTVTCVGLAAQDIIFSVEAIPTGPGKIRASARTEVGGGPAANAACAVAAIGGTSKFIGVLGGDHLGATIAADLATTGVDVSAIRHRPGLVSPLSTVVVDPTGERAIVNHTDSDLYESAELPSTHEIDGSAAVLADVRWPEGSITALQHARGLEVPGVLDFDLGYDTDSPLLEAASHVVFSAPALARLTGTDDPADALRSIAKSFGAWVAVTLGDRGSMWLEFGDPVSLPSFEVDVVDTTGAGDVFHGVFAHALGVGSGTDESMRMATAAAALSCTRMGGRDGIPTGQELQRFLEERT